MPRSPDVTRNPVSKFAVTYHRTNPPRRGGPPCPPARFDTVLTLIDVNNALDGWMHRVCADLAGCHENSVSKFAVTYHRTNPLRRGGPLCPPARFENRLRSALFDSRLHGGCIAHAPISPDVTRNPVDLSVRLGLAVSFGGQVGRPSPMAGVIISDCGGGYCHRGRYPPCQPPNGCWLAVSDS